MVRRDGTGRRACTDYLISAEPDSDRALITHMEIRTGEWANRLGITLSDDDRIIKAAGTAIRYAAQHVAHGAPEREAIPRAGATGEIDVPVAETLPAGYLECAPDVDQAAALARWKPIIEIAARNPRIAHVLGAAAVGPFVGASRQQSRIVQSHFVHLYGDGDRGKSTTLRAAGAVWGNAFTRAGTVRSWNNSSVGIGRLLGSLGILPPILDEAGMARWEPRDWGRVIYELCEGAQRTVGDRTGSGVRVSAPWDGVLISGGNGRLTAHLGAGKYAGINAKRVIELETPFTGTAADAEELDELLPGCFGHLGAALLAAFTVTDVAALIEEARGDVGMPEGGNPRTIAKNLHAHVAGAAMIDAVVGTGTMLRDAALSAARAYLDEHGHDPEHDADRLITAVRESIAAEPSCWPTRTTYLEILKPYDGAPGDPDRTLPKHGVARTINGVRADDGTWVAVFSHHVREIVAAANLDQGVTLRELHAREILQVAPSLRRRGEWQTLVQLDKGVKMYKLALPDDLTADSDERREQLPAAATARPVDDPARGGSTVSDQKEESSCPVPPATATQGRPAPTADRPPMSSTPPPPERSLPARPAPKTPGPAATSTDLADGPVLAVAADEHGIYTGTGSVIEHGDALTSMPVFLARVVEMMPAGGTVAITGELAGMLGYPKAPAFRRPGKPTRSSKRRGDRPRAGEEATTAGWEHSSAGIGAWTMWWRADAERGTSLAVVVLPWLRDLRPDPLLGPELDALTAAYRLARYRQSTGTAWTMNAGTTGVNMIKDAYSVPRGESKRWARTPLFRWDGAGTPAEAIQEIACKWEREPTPAERSMPYVLGIDGVMAYLAAEGTAVLATNALAHTGLPAGGFDPKAAGYWQVAADWSPADVRVPFPTLTGRPEGTGPHPLTTPTVRLLLEEGMPEDAITDAWLQTGYEPKSRQILRPVKDTLRDAILSIPMCTCDPAGSCTCDPDESIVRGALKVTYSEMYGMLRRGTPAVHRGDWSDTIVGTARSTTLRKVLRVGRATGRWPLRIKTDCVYYAAASLEDIPDPEILKPLADDQPPRLGYHVVKHRISMAEFLATDVDNNPRVV